jgi:hypothetical protein
MGVSCSTAVGSGQVTVSTAMLGLGDSLPAAHTPNESAL